jgi:hypothetical protein
MIRRRKDCKSVLNGTFRLHTIETSKGEYLAEITHDGAFCADTFIPIAELGTKNRKKEERLTGKKSGFDQDLEGERGKKSLGSGVFNIKY